MIHLLAPIDLPFNLANYAYSTWTALIVISIALWHHLLRPRHHRHPPPPPPGKPPPLHQQHSPESTKRPPPNSPPPPFGKRLKPPPHLRHPPPPPPHLPLSPIRLFILFVITFLLDLVSIHSYPTHKKGIIVVTGASSGIGRAAAISLAQDSETDFTVYAGVRKEQDAESIRNENIHNLIPILLDVTNQKHIDQAVITLAATQLPLVALVNNAGVAFSDAPLEIVDIQRWRRLFEVNVFGVVTTTQAFLPMLRTSQGRIINIGSIAGDIAQPMWSAYAASKHALEAISDSLRVEVRDFGISVSLIKPGEIKTEIWKKQDGNNVNDGKNVKEDGQKNVFDLKKALEKTMSNSIGTMETKELYSKGIQQSLLFMNHVATKAGDLECLPSIMTSNAIKHSILSPYPRTRYVFGGGSAVWVANLILPDKITDALNHWLFIGNGWKFFHDGLGLPLMKFLNIIFYW